MSLQPHKTDADLGHRVNQYLESIGVHTPMDFYKGVKNTTEQKKIIENSFREIMEALGLDLNDDSLIDTPKRVGKMFVDELYWGLRHENFPKITTIENKMKYDEMVVERNISMLSSCEHHFVTIDGVAHIAYIPDKKVLGLSKMNRIVEYFARRPQVQERIAEQVYHTLEFLLDTKNIAVVIEGVHYCVKSRGVEDANSNTVTAKLGGVFKEQPDVRKEFYDLINRL